MTEDALVLATLALVAWPLAAAVLLWAGPRRAGWRAMVILPSLGLLVVALAGVAAALIAEPSGRLTIQLGPPDTASFADLLWSLAPVIISVVFVAIALLARNMLLVGLAALQLVVVVPAAVRDVSEPGGAAAVGATLVVDPLAFALLAVSVVVGGLIVVFSLGYEPVHLRHAGLDPRRSNAFMGWLLVFLGAMSVLVLADDLRLLAVGWELTTLCSFVLIGFDGDDAAHVAARRALAYNLFGGTVLAAGLWLAGSHATLTDVVTQPASAGLTAVLALFVLAAATKSALAPFHPWLLGAMVAAAPVSALLHASTMVKAGSYLLLRLSPAFADAWIGLAVMGLGAFSFAGAALLALRERDLKRVLALSTVASLGLIAVSAGMASPLALAAGIVFLLLHAAAKALAFLAVGATEQVTGTRDLEALVGLGRSRPALAGPLLLAAAAMALPPFGIAVAKWALLLESGDQVVVLPVLAVGAAANVALWTAVAGRILVRRESSLPTTEHLLVPERVAIGALVVATAIGLVAAGPLAATIGDPAASVAFGAAAPFGTGWQIAAQGGVFPVLPLAVVLVLVVAGSAAYLWRQPVTPQPYLSGLNVSAGPGADFHGPRGTPETAASGGFYWGGALGDAGHPEALRRAIEVGGWIGVAVIAAIGLLGVAGWPGVS